jgi:peroxiredoxin
MKGWIQSEDLMSKVEINMPAPDFEIANFTGNNIRLADFRGKNVLLVLNRGFT